MHPILFRVGSHELATYGVLLAVALAASLALCRWLAARRGLSVSLVTELAVLVVAAGLVGAKAVDVAVRLAQGGSPSLLRGAGAVHGGLIAGLLSFALRARSLKIDPAAFVVVFPPAVALGQAIGRLGCFAAGCCYGAPGGALAVRFTSETAALVAGTPLGAPLHPVQLYDAVAHLLFAGGLVMAALRAPLRGGYAVVGGWALVEGVLRWVLETWRGDVARGVASQAPWITTGRLTSAALATCGLVLLMCSSRRTASSRHRIGKVPPARNAPSLGR